MLLGVLRSQPKPANPKTCFARSAANRQILFFHFPFQSYITLNPKKELQHEKTPA
jgi:hypothetical protein